MQEGTSPSSPSTGAAGAAAYTSATGTPIAQSLGATVKVTACTELPASSTEVVPITIASASSPAQGAMRRPSLCVDVRRHSRLRSFQPGALLDLQKVSCMPFSEQKSPVQLSIPSLLATSTEFATAGVESRLRSRASSLVYPAEQDITVSAAAAETASSRRACIATLSSEFGRSCLGSEVSSQGGVRRSSTVQQDMAEVMGRLRKHRRRRSGHLFQEGDYEQFQAALRSNSLCAGMNIDEVFELAARAELYDFGAGDKVALQGEPSTHFFVAKQGRFRVHNGMYVEHESEEASQTDPLSPTAASVTAPSALPSPMASSQTASSQTAAAAPPALSPRRADSAAASDDPHCLKLGPLGPARELVGESKPGSGSGTEGGEAAAGTGASGAAGGAAEGAARTSPSPGGTARPPGSTAHPPFCKAHTYPNGEAYSPRLPLGKGSAVSVSSNGRAAPKELLIKPGDAFGETQIAHATRHWANITAECPAQCWGVDRVAIHRVLKRLAMRTYQENTRLVGDIKLLQFIDPQQRSLLCRSLVCQIFEVGDQVTREGLVNHTNRIFVVKSGRFAVIIGGKKVDELKKGAHFGERSLLYGEPRSATVLASERSQLISIPMAVVQKLLGKSFDHIMWQNVVYVALRDLATRRGRPVCYRVGGTLDSLAEQFHVDVLEPGSKVEGREAGGVRCIVVLNGALTVRGHDGSTQTLSRGQVFGEEYLDIMDLAFTHTIENTFDEVCKIAALSSDALMSWLHASVETLSHEQKTALVRKVYLFRHISNHHCNLIAKLFRTVMRRKDAAVIQEGEIGSEFYVIRSGELVVTKKGRKLRTLGVNDYFGERGLLYNEPRTATVSCQSEQAELMVISKSVFKEIMEEGMLEYLEERIRLQQTDVNMSDLRVLRTTGRGASGVVRLVEHRTSKTHYALKCVSRKKAVRDHQQVNLRLEKEILLENDHPFIVRVVRTFSQKKYICFLTEFVSGGELYDTIRLLGVLTKPGAQFYTGSLVLALESLHERDIAYRDLKPENVMLDSQGYTKLIDFGCAVKLRSGGQVTSSIVGTPHYMAPEVIIGSGYGLTCDVWSMGVCLYEFMCGPLPFGRDTDDMMEVFRSILTDSLDFPVHLEDAASAHVLKRLLRRNIKKRIACTSSSGSDWPELKRHSFFEDFDFDTLVSRKIPPPFVPEVLPLADFSAEISASESESDEASSSSGLSDSGDEARTCKKATDWDKDF